MINLENIFPLFLEQERTFIAEGVGASASTIIQRPKWDDVYRGYPKNASGTDDMFGPDFYKMLYGRRYDLTTNLLDNEIHLYNGCAGKVSMALTLANFPIRTIGGVGADFIASEGTMKNKGFISTASKMKRWLDNAWKKDGDYHADNPSSIQDLKNLVGNRRGIYLMIAKNPTVFGASGHVTLWTDETSTKYVFGGHHYEDSAKAMYFWELK